MLKNQAIYNIFSKEPVYKKIYLGVQCNKYDMLTPKELIKWVKDLSRHFYHSHA